MGGSADAQVQRVQDEWVEIPVFNEYGEQQDMSLKLRPGNADERTEIQIGSLVIEVESVGLDRALRLLEQER